MTAKTPHLVLAGGGHAHLTTLANIHALVDRGVRVSVVGPSEFHYYSGMGAGMLGERYTPEQLRFNTAGMVSAQGGTFIHDRVHRVDGTARIIHLASGSTLAYDVASFNLGSEVPGDLIQAPTKDVFTVKPIESLREANARIKHIARNGTCRVAVVGGGPSAIEIAGNAYHLLQTAGISDPSVTLFAKGHLMDRFTKTVQRRINTFLTGRGISIFDVCPVASVTSGRVTMASGETADADVIFLATGVMPSPVFARSDLPVGPDGGLLINSYLQNPAHPEIFAGGDCAYFLPRPLDKVGVYAVRQNPVLFANIQASLMGGDLMSFDPGGDYLLIFNLGGGAGLFRKGWFQFGGRLAMHIKDAIDLRFMRRFQTAHSAGVGAGWPMPPRVDRG